MPPDYPPRLGITLTEWLPQMDIRIVLGTMVHPMGENIEEEEGR